MLHLHPESRYYWFQGKIDFRKGFDGLCGLVRDYLHREVTDGGVYIFVNSRRNQIKLLHWEGDGLAMYHKRLEKGVFEEPFRSDDGRSVLITAEQLQWILQGIVLNTVVIHKRYTTCDTIGASTQKLVGKDLSGSITEECGGINSASMPKQIYSNQITTKWRTASAQ